MATKKLKIGNVPNLRFDGFEGEWELKKLEDIAEFKVTNSFSRENLNYEIGSVKNIHYGDIHTKFQTLFDITKEKVPYINKEISINRISADFYCKEGDIVFADASEDLNDVGKSIEIVNLNSEKLLSGLHTLLARPKENYFQKGFAGHLFKSNNIRLQIQKEAQGSKVLSISAGRILNIKLSFPTLDEQQTIASFLSLIDERIQTQNKIIEQLKTLIKGLSEKLFTQRLRFKDKNGRKFPDWKEKKLEEVAEKRIVKNKSMSVNLVFTNSAVHGIVNQRDFFDKDIANKNNIHSYYVVEKDDFVYNPRISNGAPVGPISRNKIGIGVMSPLYMIFRFEGVNHDFIEFFYSTNVWHEHMGNIANFGARSDRMSFLSNDFFKMLLPLPCLEEQSKIANFLSAIDEKIEAEKEILQQLESQKKYLLQNLFI